jgi:hypothetical protein
MRSLLFAVAVLGLAVALLSRSVWAEPPPAMEPRDLKKIAEALKKKPALKAQLASVRFAGEVLGIKTLEVPVGSSLETLGPWSDNRALLNAEAALDSRQCGALTAAELKAASAILTDSAEALPVTLRAYTLGQQGKSAEAADLFATFIEQQLPGGCPGEHPMYSERRTSRISFALKCLKVYAPKRDTAPQEKALERAKDCTSRNTAVG